MVKLGKPESGEEGSVEAEEEGLGGWGRTQGGTGEAQHPDTQPPRGVRPEKGSRGVGVLPLAEGLWLDSCEQS